MVFLFFNHQWRTCVPFSPFVLSGLLLWFSTDVFLIVPAGWDRFMGVWGASVGGVGVRWCMCFKFLPEHRQSRPVLLLRYLHTDFVCMYPWSSDTPVGGPHQSDSNPTLDVSTRLWVGLLPFWCEATGYPFQGSRRLHPEKSINGGNEGWEVATLLKASLQVHLLLTPLRLLMTSLRGPLPIGLLISVHNTHVVNTVYPIGPEFPDQKVSLLFRGRGSSPI